MRIVTAVERPDVILRILRHLDISTRARAPTAHRCEERDPLLRVPGGDIPGQETLEAPNWDAFAADPPFADDVAPDSDPGWPEDALPPDED